MKSDASGNSSGRIGSIGRVNNQLLVLLCCATSIWYILSLSLARFFFISSLSTFFISNSFPTFTSRIHGPEPRVVRPPPRNYQEVIKITRTYTRPDAPSEYALAPPDPFPSFPGGSIYGCPPRESSPFHPSRSEPEACALKPVLRDSPQAFLGSCTPRRSRGSPCRP